MQKHSGDVDPLGQWQHGKRLVHGRQQRRLLPMPSDPPKPLLLAAAAGLIPIVNQRPAQQGNGADVALAIVESQLLGPAMIVRLPPLY